MLHPLQKAAGIVQTQPQKSMLLDGLKKWKIRLIARLMEDMVEITDRLMAVNHENEINIAHVRVPTD